MVRIQCKKEVVERTWRHYAGQTLCLAEPSEYSGATKMKERKDAKENGKRQKFCCDSRFKSVNSVQGMKRELGHKYLGVLKKNHAETPKDEIDKIMKDWPSGSSSCMECKEHKIFMCA